MNDDTYLASMAAWLHTPKSTATDSLGADLGLGDDPWAHLGLRFYRRSAHSRRFAFLKLAFPGLLDALDAEPRERLKQAFIEQGSGAEHDWTRNAQVLLNCIGRLIESGEIPAGTADAASHRLALFEMGQRTERPARFESIEKLAINPTLDVRSYPRNPTVGVDADLVEQEFLVGYFLVPDTLKSRWLAFEPSVFGWMRIVDEGIDHAVAAKESGLSLDDVHGELRRYADLGLFVAKS